MSTEIELNLNTTRVNAELDVVISKLERAQSLTNGLSANGVVSPELARSGMVPGASPGGSQARVNLTSTATSNTSGGQTNVQAQAAAFLAQNMRGFPAHATVTPEIAAQLAAAGVIPGPQPVAPSASSAQAVASLSQTAARVPSTPAPAVAPAGARMYAQPAGPAAPNWFQSTFPTFSGMAGGFIASGGMGNALSRGTAAYLGLSGAGDMLGLYASNTASGEINPMQAAQIYGGISGAGLLALAGGLLTPTAPGVGMMAGMLAGQQFGSAIAATNMAPFMNTRNMAQSLASVSGRMGVSPYDLINASGGQYGSGVGGPGSRQTSPAGPGLSQYAQQISSEGKSGRELALISSGLYTGTDIISGQQLARTYATTASALLASGEDPASALNPSLALARKYGINADRMAAMGAPVAAARNRLGRNAADLFLEFGPEAYGAAFDGGYGLSDMDGGLDALKTYQITGNEQRRAMLQVRGAGRALSAASRRRMTAIATLPGGRNSVAYLEAFSAARAGSLHQFDDDITTQFSIPQVALREQIARAQFRPYAPGEVFGAQVGLIRSQFGEANAIEGFVSRRRAAGELSVDEEYSLRSRASSNRIAAYESLSSIAMGAQNLLPGIAATGAFGAGLRRFTGMQQASTYLNPYAFFRRDVGFMGGRAQRRADAFLEDMGVPSMPMSRSGDVNNPGMADGRIVALLERIARSLEKGNGSFQRPRRGPGDLPPAGAGANAPWG